MSAIHLWRYRENRKNYSGYHLTADKGGCEILATLLSKFENIKKPETSEIILSPLTQKILDVPNNVAGNATVVSMEKWYISVEPAKPAEFFEFSESHPICFLKLSPQQAGCILEGVRDIRNGKGDYCVGGDGDHVIWFGGTALNKLRERASEPAGDFGVI